MCIRDRWNGNKRLNAIKQKKTSQQIAGLTVAAGFETPTLFTIAADLTKMQVVADVDEACLLYTSRCV